MELYVHLPFCVRKCRYCDFASFPGLEGSVEAYVDAVLREAELRRNECPEPFDTVYFGGGTPSLIPPAALARLIRGLKERLDLASVREWTSEANPGTVTKEWLDTALEGGVNRVSLGMQAAQRSLLSMLGRIHCPEDTERSVKAARDAGFRNLSLDLMFGLPGQTADDWTETLEAALALNPEHLSAYGLIPEEGTPLYEDLRSGKMSLPEPEEEREMYGALLRTAEAAGFHQYEISNFALPGFECLHNAGYWRQVPYLGLGLSAASMTEVRKGPDGMRYVRRTNVRTPEEYMRGILSGTPALAEKAETAPEEARFETMMLGLRMNRGVGEREFSAMHGVSLEACFGERLRALRGRGLVLYENGFWRLTRDGMDLQNTVLVELMD